MARENLYILLDLDPTTDSSWAAIEPKLKRKLGIWSSQSNSHADPAKRAEYKELMRSKAEFEAILRDDSQRNAEAEQFKVQNAARSAVTIAELETLVRAMSNQGAITPAQFTQLKENAKSKKFPEADLDALLKRSGIVVKAAIVEKQEDRLDSSKAKAIRDNLAQLDKIRAAESPPKPSVADLYDYLGAQRTAATKTLHGLASAHYEQVRNLPKDGLAVSLEQNLLGECLSIFGTDAKRAEYEATLRFADIEVLLQFVAAASSGERRIKLKTVEEVIVLAAKKGIAEEKIKSEIRLYADKQGLSVELPASGVIPTATRRCGACSELILPNTAKCGKCGRSARTDCPKCKTANASDAIICSNPNCGFSVGDMHLAEGLVRSAKAVLGNDPAKATESLREALLYHPQHGEATRMLADLDKRDNELESMRKAIRDDLTRKCFHGVRVRIEDLARRTPDDPRVADYRRQVGDSIAAAEAAIARALRSEKENKPDDALDQYREALRLCADSDAAKAGLSRCPPAPPLDAVVTKSPAEVIVAWKPSPARGRIAYRVVRKIGAPPTAPGDGQTLATVHDTRFVDAQAPVGVSLCYAIYAEREGVPSDRAAVAKSVVCMPDATKFRLTPGDGRIELAWTPPDKFHGIEIWRQPNQPPERGAGTRLTSILGDTAVDSGLSNGTTYGYRLIVLYRDADQSVVASPGVVEVSAPSSPPRPVTDLSVRLMGDGYYEAKWSQPPTGLVRVYRLAKSIGNEFRVGRQLTAKDVEQLGAPLPASGPAFVRERVGSSDVFHLFPVTLLGGIAVAGKETTCAAIEDLKEFRADVDGRILRCRWSFPEKIDVAILVVRGDRAADGPDDPTAERHTWTRAQTKASGEFTCSLPGQTGSAYVTAYAGIQRDGTWRYSTGLSLELRTHERCRIRYRLKSRKRWFLFDTGTWELVLNLDRDVPLPELQLVSRPGGIPLSPTDGETVLTIPSDDRPHGLTRRWRLTDPTLVPKHCRLHCSAVADSHWLELLSEN